VSDGDSVGLVGVVSAANGDKKGYCVSDETSLILSCGVGGS